MSGILVVLLHLYQRTLSPDHGPARVFFPFGVCRYAPTCSQYAVDAITTHGSVAGLLLAARRLLRCHPFASGGIDPAPGRPRRKLAGFRVAPPASS